jgi:hypothetical protein
MKTYIISYTKKEHYTAEIQAPSEKLAKAILRETINEGLDVEGEYWTGWQLGAVEVIGEAK